MCLVALPVIPFPKKVIVCSHNFLPVIIVQFEIPFHQPIVKVERQHAK
jgi:hypothetical protein